MLYIILLMFGSLFNFPGDADIDSDGGFFQLSKLQLAAIDGLVYLAFLAAGLVVFQLRQTFRKRKSPQSAAFEKLLQSEPGDGPEPDK